MENTCRKCGLVKDVTKFVPDKRVKTGYTNSCLSCRDVYRKKYHQEHRDKVLTQLTAYYTNNKASLQAKNKQYNLVNKEALTLKKRDYTARTKDEKAAYDKIYREKNKAKVRLRKQIDPNYKLRYYFTHRILDALRGKTKSAPTMQLLGCSIPEFRQFIALKFKDGMTWENRGLFTWHLEHILPCASFDLSNPEQQKKCFHYTNYQPLWALDNLRKGSKVISS